MSDEIADRLRQAVWNAAVGPADYADEGGARYQAAVLDQYKMYVEMADRIAARRSLTNTFFLTLNSAIFTIIGVFWRDGPDLSQGWIVLPLAIAIAECTAWYWLVRSYRLLSSAKYAVVGALEDRLPAFAYSKAEWETALGSGRDRSRYVPLTHMEQWVPMLFGLAYAASAVAVLVGA